MTDAALNKVAQFIVRRARSMNDLALDVGALLRTALDEVIDGKRTGRWSVDDCEKTEKTYIGTKVEILFRNYLGVRKGAILDLMVDGEEVDVKFTIGGTWMIPQEAMGHLCALLTGNDDTETCSLGLIRISDAVLTEGSNQDKKRSISAAGKQQIFWLVKDAPLPENFLLKLPRATALQIMDPAQNGQQRINRLFRLCQGLVIDRHTIEVVAQQKDALKRVRSNGGARTHLWPERIAILSGKYDQDLLALVGFNGLNAEQFLSISVDNVAAPARTRFEETYRERL